MAIYRIKSKLFTRAEKEMIKQIWRKTKGLRELPGGVTSLEDAKALKRLSGQLNSRRKKVKITPEIRKALDNLGFTKATEDTINKMRSKYKNKAAADRLDKMNDKKINRLSNLSRSDPNYYEYLMHRTKLSMEKELKLKRKKKTKKLWDQAVEDSIVSERNSTRDPSLARFYRKKLGGSVLRRSGSDNASAIRLKQNASFITPEDIRSFDPKIVPVTQKDLKNLNKNKHAIIVSGDAGRKTVLHEMGHIKSYGEFKNTTNAKNGTLINGIDSIAEENMASANALHVLRNQRGVEKDKEALDKSISTYMHGLRYDLNR